MNLPILCGQYKKDPSGRKYEILDNKLTSLFEWCQFY